MCSNGSAKNMAAATASVVSTVPATASAATVNLLAVQRLQVKMQRRRKQQKGEHAVQHQPAKIQLAHGE